MKKLIFAICLSLAAVELFAMDTTWISSNTATADTTLNLCMPKTGSTSVHAVFHGVRVNSPAAGTFTIYASSGSANNPIAEVNTSTTTSFDYDVLVSSGLTYSQTGTANLTILYNCY